MGMGTKWSTATEGLGKVKGAFLQWMARIGLNISLSRLQTFVSLAAGIVSITVAIPNFFRSGAIKGELVAIVQDAKTDKAISDAVIEVLTPQGTVVTTLTPDLFGKARCTLDEGRFRVHVSHPRFGDQIREVQIVSKQTTQLQVQLRASSSSFPHTIRRFFSH
jgi:hypothetical protein